VVRSIAEVHGRKEEHVRCPMGGVHTDDHRAPATERWRRRTHTPGRMRTSLILEFDYSLKVDVYSRERAPTAPAPFAGAASGLAGLVLGLLLGALRTTEGRALYCRLLTSHRSRRLLLRCPRCPPVAVAETCDSSGCPWLSRPSFVASWMRSDCHRPPLECAR
jgi:hypothetical protein